MLNCKKGTATTNVEFQQEIQQLQNDTEHSHIQTACVQRPTRTLLECTPMPNVMAALPNIGGALFSTSQSLADAHY